MGASSVTPHFGLTLFDWKLILLVSATISLSDCLSFLVSMFCCF